MKIKNQIAIVTGGTKGIGAGISRMLLEEGAKVVAIYSGDTKNAENFVNSLSEFTGKLVCVQGDVSKYSDIEKAFQITQKEFGTVSILINNAGKLTIPDLPTQERYERIFQINFFSQVYAIEIFNNQYIHKEGEVGKIINMNSIAGVNPFGYIGGTRCPEYCTSKAAGILYTKISASHLGGNILVNSISPGNTKTPQRDKATDEFKKLRIEESLIGRFLKPSEIAHTAKFILENDAINGEDIVVDGGNIIYNK